MHYALKTKLNLICIYRFISYRLDYKNQSVIIILYSEMIAVCSQIHTKHINALCGQNVEMLNVLPADTYRVTTVSF
jgi:hypothetical protein